MNSFSKYILLTIFWLVTVSISFSQQNKIDSLVTLLKKDKNDTTKLSHLTELCRAFGGVGLNDSVLVYANKLKEQSTFLLKKTSNAQVRKTIKKYQAMAYNNIGVINERQTNFDAAIKNFVISLEISKSIMNYKNMANSY